MNPPQVYTCSQSWTTASPTPLPIPSLGVIPEHQPQAFRKCSHSVRWNCTLRKSGLFLIVDSFKSYLDIQEVYLLTYYEVDDVFVYQEVSSNVQTNVTCSACGQWVPSCSPRPMEPPSLVGWLPQGLPRLLSWTLRRFWFLFFHFV